MAVLVAVGGALPGCDLLTDPDPVPTTIDVSHGSLEFTALGDSVVLQATVRDQNAQGMAEFQWIFGPVVTADDASRQRLILEVPLLAGLEVSAEVAPGPPSELMVLSGSGQVAHRSTTLPEPIVVRLEDRFANPAAGLLLTLDSKAGHGTLEANALETDPKGEVRITWTLGETEGKQSFQVMHESPQVDVVAEARIVPVELVALAGDGQRAEPEEDLAEAFTVQLIDQVQLGVKGAQVRFTVTSGTARFDGEVEVVTTTDTGGVAASDVSGCGHPLAADCHRGPSLGEHQYQRRSVRVEGGPVPGSGRRADPGAH